MDRMSLSIGIRAFFCAQKGAAVAKTFNIVKKKNLLTGEERAVNFACEDDQVSRDRVLRKLNQTLQGNESLNFEFCYGESLYMHLLPGLSKTTVQELSKRMYSTAYAVCKKKKTGEAVLYLSLFKDTALRFKASIPAATRKVEGRDVPNPDFYVKELRLCL